MKTSLLAAAAATLAIVASTAPASARPLRTAAPTATAATDNADSKLDTRRICVVQAVTGSRIERKECRTRADWAKDNIDPLAKAR